MLRASIVLVLALACSLGAQPLMTLEDAIAIGLRNGYDIRIARNQALQAKVERGLGLAGLLPTLNLSGGYTRSGNQRDVNLPPSSSGSDLDIWAAEISLNWTLFDGFRMLVDYQRYHELARLGENVARYQIENSVVAISRAYYNLVLQERLLAIARETREISQTRLERERVRNELGGASSTDFLNAQVAFNADETSFLDQRLQVTVARQQLNVLLGRDPKTEFTVSSEISTPEVTMDYADMLDRALSDNSRLRVAELNKAVARRGVQSARSNFLPRLSAFASYGYTDQTLNSDAGEFAHRDIGTQEEGTTIGLSLSLNLFNGLRDKVNLQNAKIEANNADLALRDARNRTHALVRERLDTYRQRMEVVVLEEQNIGAARQNLELQKERHELGATNSLAFRDAQVNLARAQTSLIKARYEARIAHLELEQLIGALSLD